MEKQAKTSTTFDLLRQKAEYYLKKNPFKTGSKLSETDALRLIHELEVHQIELEMQNEELVLAKNRESILATEKYAELYDFAPSGFYTLSKTGMVVDLNLCGSQMLGSERSVLKHSLFDSFVSTQNKPIFKLFLGQVFKSKNKETCEVTLSSNGSLPMYVFLTGIVCENGEQCLVTATDITKHKLAEDALRESTDYYRFLFENSSDAIFFTQSDGRIYSANPAACRISGRSEDEIKKLGRRGIVDESDPRLNLALEQRLRTGRFEGELNFQRKDGTSYPAELSLMNFKDSAGNERTSIFARDITIRKRVNKALLENNSRLNLAMKVANMAWWEMDITTGNVTFEKRKAEMLGYPAGGFNHYKDFMALVHPDDSDRAMKAMQDHFDGLTEKYEIEYQIRTKSGDYRWFYDIGSIVKRDVQGRPLIITGLVIDITSRKQVEETLKVSEKRRLAILNTAMDGFWLLDMEGKLLEVNETYCLMSGYSAQELLTMHIHDLEVFEPDSETTTHIKKVMLKGEERYESRHRRKNGTTFDVEISIQFQPIDKGTFIAFLHDISIRKEAEEVIKKSEEKFRFLVWDMQVGILAQGPKGEILLSNLKLLELLDVTLNQLMDKTPADRDWKVILEDGTPISGFKHPIEQAMATRQSVRDVVIGVYRPSKGDLVWLLVNAEPRLNADGKIRKVVCTFVDITQRKRVEQELMESEQRLKFHFENSPLAVVEWNANFIVTQWSCEAEHMFGWCREEVVGKRIDTISLMYNEDIPIVSNTIKSLMSGKSVVQVSTTRNLTKAGAIIECTWYNSIILDQNGEMVAVMSLVQDITKRKQAEAALNQLNEELEVRVEERTNELLKSNVTLRQTKDKYRTVADYAYNWEFWIDQNGVMLYCSPSCERITGYKASDFDQNPKLLFEIIYPDDLNDYQTHMQTEKMTQDANLEIQFRIVRFDGSIRWIGHICQPIYDESGIFRGSRGSNKDITERKLMEQLLKTSNHKYELLSENITDGIFICRSGYFEYVNKSLKFIFGYGNNELEGMKLIRLVITDSPDELEDFLTLNGTLNKSWNIEVECLRKDHSKVYVEILFNYVANEMVTYGVVHDITEKKQIQKNIVNAIIRTEEKERGHFSKELHDGLGPLLSTIKLYLQWSERPKTSKSRMEIIQKAEEILEEALATVKEISNKLSPHLLTNYGLTSAIQSFVDKLEESSAMRITFESNWSRRLDIDIEVTIYRAIIECINNTIKHARANNITIILNDTGSQFHVRYLDDGIGFDLKETLYEQKGLGLFNIQNRVQTIGGKITLFSQPGKGVDYKIAVNILN